MDWADAPAWAALVVSIVAVAITALARKDGRRAADAAEAALAEQRAANAPRVRLELESGEYFGRFHLRNYGDLSACNIRMLEDLLPGGQVWPDDVTLRPHEAHTFVLAPGLIMNAPPHLRFVWDGQEDPVAVAIPAHRSTT